MDHVDEIKRMLDEQSEGVRRIEHGWVEIVIVDGAVDRMVLHHSIKNRRKPLKRPA